MTAIPKLKAMLTPRLPKVRDSEPDPEPRMPQVVEAVKYLGGKGGIPEIRKPSRNRWLPKEK
jgi:hypothetical protein